MENAKILLWAVEEVYAAEDFFSRFSNLGGKQTFSLRTSTSALDLTLIFDYSLRSRKRCGALEETEKKVPWLAFMVVQRGGMRSRSTRYNDEVLEFWAFSRSETSSSIELLETQTPDTCDLITSLHYQHPRATLKRIPINLVCGINVSCVFPSENSQNNKRALFIESSRFKVKKMKNSGWS